MRSSACPLTKTGAVGQHVQRLDCLERRLQEVRPEAERSFPERFCEALGIEPEDTGVALERRLLCPVLLTPTKMTSTSAL